MIIGDVDRAMREYRARKARVETITLGVLGGTLGATLVLLAAMLGRYLHG